MKRKCHQYILKSVLFRETLILPSVETSSFQGSFIQTSLCSGFDEPPRSSMFNAKSDFYFMLPFGEYCILIWILKERQKAQ